MAIGTNSQHSVILQTIYIFGMEKNTTKVTSYLFFFN